MTLAFLSTVAVAAGEPEVSGAGLAEPLADGLLEMLGVAGTDAAAAPLGAPWAEAGSAPPVGEQPATATVAEAAKAAMIRALRRRVGTPEVSHPGASDVM